MDTKKKSTKMLSLDQASLLKMVEDGTNKVSWRKVRNLHKKQCQALDACVKKPNQFVLYGGSGFAGKSHLLRSAFVEFNGKYKEAGYPNQWGALFCTTYTDLVNRHIPLLNSELSEFGRVKESATRGLCFEFNDPAMGGLYLRNVDNPDKYRGAQFPYILVDELTELTRSDFDDLLYALRSPLPLPFKPFLAGSNPDGIGHSWVKKLWIEQDFTDERLDPDEFTFIPALPTDNPTYTTANYERTLASQPEWKRKARLEGSWDAPAGARFPQITYDTHIFHYKSKFPKGVPKHWPIIMGVDWGKAAPFAALWIAVDEDKNCYIYREVYEPDLSSDMQVKRIVNSTLNTEKIDILYCDSQMWEKRRDPHYQRAARGPSAADIYYKALKGDHRFGNMVKGYKGLRSLALDTLDRLLTHDNGFPNLYIEKQCINTWRELTGAVWAKGQGGWKEDIDVKCPDHAITALYYALHTFFKGADVEPKELTTEDLRINRLEELAVEENKILRAMVRNYKSTGQIF